MSATTTHLAVAAFDSEAIKVELTPSALFAKDQVLYACGKITEIKTEADMEEANPVLRMLKSTLKDMDASRESVKKPVLELGRQIDKTAKEYSAELLAEETRLKDLVAGFLEKQRAQQIKDIRATGETSVTATGGDGVTASEEWDFEVQDAHKAYLANPGLFTLTPNRAAIIGGAKLGAKMPHIRVFKKTSIRVKA